MIVGSLGLIALRASVFPRFLALILGVFLIRVVFTSRDGFSLNQRSWALQTSLSGNRKRNRNAGRWLGAPVAELDKSTLGKLLTSRASRDPSRHVIVSRTPTPVCSDALYDPELDGSSPEF